MRKKVVGTILIGMLIMSACSFSNSKEAEQNSVSASAEKSSELFISPDQTLEEEFNAQMPVHFGIWQAADYGRTNYYYEFSKEYIGRRLGANAGDVEEFSYEVNDGDNLVMHYADRDEYAHYSFGDDGKHLVLTYQDYQQNLQWMSHGTLEDMGGLGLSFTAKDITPFGCTLQYSQSGGYVTGEITADNYFSLIVQSKEDGEWGCTDYFGIEGQTFAIEKDSSGEIQIDWTSKLGMLVPGDYVLSFQIRDIRNVGGDWDSFDYRVWFSVSQNDGERLIEKVVAEAGADISDARYSVVYDFDSDGVMEAFVYLGDAPDEYATCAGEVWYVDGDTCVKIKECGSFFVHGDKVIDMYPVGDSMVIELEEAYATSTVSYLFMMDNGEWKESAISGLGYFFKPDYVSDYCVSVSAYDSGVDYEEGKEEESLYTGHTWKNYYFFYDENSGDFKEYVGKEISEEELKAACGLDLAAEIREAGYQVDDIFKRENGIINVNYSKTERGDAGFVYKEFHNVTYNELNQRYADAWKTNGNSWQDSDFGGTYLKAITER